MAFDPLSEKGIPLDQQVRNWSELNTKPYDPLDVDPWTRCRVIGMNGIEVESIMFSHQFARHTDVPEVKEKLAEIRRIEQQQQKAVNWLIPGGETTLEVTLGYEQIAVDLTAWLARSEPDPYFQQQYDFALLEDFDHLYRYANLYEMVEGKQAEAVTSTITEIMPGRPGKLQHRNPVDNMRRHYDKHTVAPISRLHALTIVSSEQQTMNYYMNIGNRFVEPIARALYLEIGQVEEEHVTQYEGMLDPGESWFEQLVMHDYNECYMYWSWMQQESDPRIKQLWELHLNMEIAHLQAACDLLRRYDGREPEEILPASVPEPVILEENKQYVREVLATQVDLTTLGTGFVMDSHKRFQENLATVNAGGSPMEQVVEQHRDAFGGKEYRMETDGPHPVEGLRDPALVNS
jgi:rubrerythrin